MTNKEAYILFCKKESEIPLFSKPWYLDVVCGEEGWDILIIKKGNEVTPIPHLSQYNKNQFLTQLFVLLHSCLCYCTSSFKRY